MMHTDTAIDVDGVAQRSVQLGDLVTVARLDGALHDVVLSARPVRALAYGRIAQWVGAYLPRPAPVVLVVPDVDAPAPDAAPPASRRLGPLLSRLGAGAHRAGRAVARTVGSAVGTLRGTRAGRR